MNKIHLAFCILILMIAHAVWSRRLPEVKGYRVESRDMRRHGIMKEPLKEEVLSRRVVTGKLVCRFLVLIINCLLRKYNNTKKKVVIGLGSWPWTRGLEIPLPLWTDRMTDTIKNNHQWRIQDFPQAGAPTPKSANNFQFFAKKCMKMKEFGPPGGGGARPWRPPLDPPMITFPQLLWRVATVCCTWIDWFPVSYSIVQENHSLCHTESARSRLGMVLFENLHN